MAKIVGNIVGLPNPQPDWNQTDETKADYVKNKPAVIKNGEDSVNINANTSMKLKVLDGELNLHTGYGNDILFTGNNLQLSQDDTQVNITPDYVNIQGNLSVSKIIPDMTEDYSGSNQGIEIGGMGAIYMRADDSNVNISTGYNTEIDLRDEIVLKSREHALAVNDWNGVTVDNKLIATQEYVDEVLKDIDGSGFVNKTGDEEISGKKTFTDKTTMNELMTSKISGKEGYLEIETDGMEINSGSAVFIKSATAISLEGDVYINNKIPASTEYVDEALKDIGGGGNVTIDDTPTQGSKNAVSSGGTYSELSRLNGSLNDAKSDIEALIYNKVDNTALDLVNRDIQSLANNKADKSYVDNSIQQSILDSWEAEV